VSELAKRMRQCAASKQSVFEPYWEDAARRLLLQAADTIDAADFALRDYCEQLRLAQEQLKQTRAMLELAAELLPVPEHNQGDQWFEDQGKINEFLAAPPTKVEGNL
jgi:hypothetical protein